MRRRWRLNLTPVIARVLRAVGAAEDFRAAAVSARLVAPGDETQVLPALYLEGELERIRGTHDETDLGVELERLRGGRVSHAPTLAYVLRDVTWSSGHAYAGRSHHRATDTGPQLRSSGDIATLDAAVVASTYYGGRYFGHWLTDDVPLAMAGHEIAPPIVPLRPWTAHQRQYLELLDLGVLPVGEAWMRELTILDDLGANPSKRARWEHMRARVRAVGGEAPPRRVMLLRGSTGVPRPLTNELEIAEHLAARGFTILEAEKLTVPELARELAGASVVLGVEGSQLLHGIFGMADGGTVVTLQPPDRFITVIKVYCDALALRYALVVGEGTSGGFRIDVDRVVRTVDLALAARVEHR